MHELSIAMNIVEIAEEQTLSAGGHKVSHMELEVGQLSGVVYDALDFAMEEAIKDSVLESAKIDIIKTAGRARCLQCHTEFELEEVFTPCPACASFENEIISGEELKVLRLTIE